MSRLDHILDEIYGVDQEELIDNFINIGIKVCEVSHECEIDVRYNADRLPKDPYANYLVAQLQGFRIKLASIERTISSSEEVGEPMYRQKDLSGLKLRVQNLIMSISTTFKEFGVE